MNIKKIFLAVLLSFVFILNGFSQTAEEIVAKYSDAIGGKAQWDSIKTQKITGTVKINDMMELKITSISKKPNFSHVELEVNGMKITQGFDGTIAWMVNPMMGSDKPIKMNEENTKDIRDRGLIGGQLMNYKSQGSTIELVGTEDMDGKKVYNIKLTDKEGQVFNYYIDTDTYLLYKIYVKLTRNGNEVTRETFYSDYRDVNKVKSAFKSETEATGDQFDSQSVTIDKIEHNLEVDDNIFKMPTETK